MRHKKSFNHLSRKTGHRRAMLANMASSLIIHKRIETTTAKAKALKRYVEPLITRSREDSTHSRRVVFSYLQDKEAVTELFREVSVKVAERPGGYTRIIRLDRRLGDNADMCLIELVDYNENLLAEKAASQKSTSRRRRSRRKGSGDAQKATAAGGSAAGQQEAPAQEAPAQEAPAQEAQTQDESAARDESPTQEASAESTEAEAKAKAESAESAEAETKAEPKDEADAQEEPEEKREEPKEDDEKKGS